MRVFLTGATGFVGSAIVSDLIAAGHDVLGLTRSDTGARRLREAGASVHRGDINDLASLRLGAQQCDGVIHTAFDHDFQNFAANCDKDRQVILALGQALAGSSRPLIMTSVTPVGSPAPGQPAVETVFNAAHPNPRKASELACNELLEQGVQVSVVRLSQIHDTRKQGLVTLAIELALARGVCAYVGDGLNAWSAAHVLDTAVLYRLALEANVAGARYHATAEEAIPFKAIAQALGARLDLPVLSLPAAEAAAHFGWLAPFVEKDMSASSALTRERLGWQPAGPGLLDSLGALVR